MNNQINGITITTPITITVPANRLYELGLKYTGLQECSADTPVNINLGNQTFKVSEQTLNNSGWVRQ